MALPIPKQDLMTWGTMLEHETDEISRHAKRLFRRAKAAFGSGHTISGLSGNDKALACVCLCLVKTNLVTCDRKTVETSLQRTSGVRARIFSSALKELPKILQATNNTNPSPSRKSPRKAINQPESETGYIAGGSSLSNSKGKEVTQRAVAPDPRDSLIKSSLKRPPAMRDLADEDDELLLSPSTKKRIRISENQSPSKTVVGSSKTPKAIFNNTRTIHKTPLNLPIQKPLKPLCIFQSHPLINTKKSDKPHLDFTNWNWKSDLFRMNWSLDDIREWEQWNKKSLETSLS